MKFSDLGAALITGAAKRVGREIAMHLACLGYDVAISYNNSKKEAFELKKEIEEKYLVKCEVFACDLQNSAEVNELASLVLKKFPNWNLLVNNASIFTRSNFLESDEDELLENLNVHLFSPLILSKIFAKNIKKKNIKNAQIINILDKNISRYETAYFYYLLTKQFLAKTTKMLSLQLAPEVRVNGIAPGFILPEEDENLRVKNLEQKIPLKKQGDVKNISQTVEFLLKNDFISGQIIFVDGAASLNHAG